MNVLLNLCISKLSQRRSVIHSKSWYTVGCVIHSKTKGSEEGYNIWHKFSKQDENYNKEACDKKWMIIKKNNYRMTLKTLFSFIEDDEKDRLLE